jgi:Protein of unknown function (DUF3179)
LKSSSEETRNSRTRLALWIGLIGTLVPIVCLAIPMYVIRPFRPQDPSQLALALTVRDLAPWLTAVCAIAVVIVSALAWGHTRRKLPRIALVAFSILAIAGACLTHVNIFEIMFHPYDRPVFGEADALHIDADDKVLAVRIGTEAHAYPIRTMGYHHIVNDTLGNTPIAVTYCTLCHTGLVWNRLLDGRTLYFRLAGINNGNALMRDVQTNSIWQQSTGQAIFGPLKGRQLTLVHSDELTFALWRKEQPEGLVLQPDVAYASEYEDKDWEQHVEKTRTVVDTRKSGIAPHELMLGVTIAGKSKAYPLKSILAARLIQDQIAGVPLVILVGPDKESIRVFKARLTESSMTFLSTQNAFSAPGAVMQDSETSGTWNFEGCAITGKLTGMCLVPVDSNKDYWFDWMNHHPDTQVFKS